MFSSPLGEGWGGTTRTVFKEMKFEFILQKESTPNHKAKFRNQKQLQVTKIKITSFIFLSFSHDPLSVQLQTCMSRKEDKKEIYQSKLVTS